MAPLTKDALSKQVSALNLLLDGQNDQLKLVALQKDELQKNIIALTSRVASLLQEKRQLELELNTLRSKQK